MGAKAADPTALAKETARERGARERGSKIERGEKSKVGAT